jgi:chromosome segregation ATPase
MTSLIDKGNDIKEQCEQIEKLVNEGKEFAADIDERLNNIINPSLPEIEAKYDSKNDLIDQCDDLFDSCEERLKSIDTKLKSSLSEVEEAVRKLKEQSPINNPSVSGQDNNDFIEQVSDLTMQAVACRDKLETLQVAQAETNERFNEVIRPLNELADREV